MIGRIRSLSPDFDRVLLGSVAGLTTVIFAGIFSSLPGTVRSAWLPTFNSAASFWAMWAFAITLEVSITTRSGMPAAAISPGNRARSVTTPLMGLRISV